MSTDAYDPQAHEQTAAIAKFFCSELKRNLERNPLPKRILVAPCGSGIEAAYICEEMNAVVEAIDPDVTLSPELLRVPKLRFEITSIDTLPFADHWFDAIYFNDIQEPQPNFGKLLGELARVLSPSGWLFVATVNRHRIAGGVRRTSQPPAAHELDRQPLVACRPRDLWSSFATQHSGRWRSRLERNQDIRIDELDQTLAMHFPVRSWRTQQYLRAGITRHRFETTASPAHLHALQWHTFSESLVFCRKAHADV
jgi:SAM-dependent methyltransferase